MPDEGENKPKFLGKTETIFVIASGLAAVVTLLWATIPQAEKAKTYGNCAYGPQTPPNIKRLNGYIEEGQRYTRIHSYKLAAHQFQEVIDADPHFLGAHQDLGVVQLAQGKPKDAQASFEEEISLIDCLRSTKDDLYRFAYLLDKDNASHQTSGSIYLERLNAAEDTAHYNLACAYARQGERAASLDELNKAAQYHSIKRETVADDPDLLPVRHETGYEAALAHF